MIVACDIPRADGTHSITRESINCNAAATQRLATMFGTKVDMIQAAIAQVNNGITQVEL